MCWCYDPLLTSAPCKRHAQKHEPLPPYLVTTRQCGMLERRLFQGSRCSGACLHTSSIVQAAAASMLLRLMKTHTTFLMTAGITAYGYAWLDLLTHLRKTSAHHLSSNKNNKYMHSVRRLERGRLDCRLTGPDKICQIKSVQ